MGCMAPLPVREPFDVGKHGHLGLLSRVKVLQIHAVGLSGRDEALCHGVIPPVALATPPGRSPGLAQELSIAVRALLTAPVALHDASRGGLALTNRHG